MNRKYLYATVAVLLLLVAAIAQREPDSTSQQLPNMPGFQWQKVTLLEIFAQGQEQLRLEKGDQGWHIYGQTQAANSDAVEQLLLSLQDMHPKRIAARNTEHYQRFAVADQDVTVKLSNAQGATLLHVVIGNPATDLRSTYIRIVGDKTVLTVDRILTWQVKRTKEAWLAKEKDTE